MTVLYKFYSGSRFSLFLASFFLFRYRFSISLFASTFIYFVFFHCCLSFLSYSYPHSLLPFLFYIFNLLLDFAIHMTAYFHFQYSYRICLSFSLDDSLLSLSLFIWHLIFTLDIIIPYSLPLPQSSYYTFYLPLIILISLYSTHPLTTFPVLSNPRSAHPATWFSWFPFFNTSKIFWFRNLAKYQWIKRSTNLRVGIRVFVGCWGEYIRSHLENYRY